MGTMHFAMCSIQKRYLFFQKWCIKVKVLDLGAHKCENSRLWTWNLALNLKSRNWWAKSLANFKMITFSLQQCGQLMKVRSSLQRWLSRFCLFWRSSTNTNAISTGVRLYTVPSEYSYLTFFILPAALKDMLNQITNVQYALLKTGTL